MAEASARRSRRSRRQEEAQRQARQQLLIRIGLAGLAAVLLILGIWWWAAGGSEASEQPVSSISDEISGNHLHGLGYDSERDRLLLASHYGLFSLENGQLYQIGDSRDDFMGFSLHPDDPTIVYRSGHPALGGHLGVERSTDGGLTFEQIFAGVADEVVDFHSMTISPANPEVLYGWFQGSLYRTQDAGETWEAFQPEDLSPEGLCWGAHCLAADNGDAARVYAGTPNGLYVSDNYGDDWTLLNAEVGSVAGVGINPSDPERIVIFSLDLGLAISNDGGQSWEPGNQGLDLEEREFVFEIVFHPDDPERLFIATTGNQVFESTDGGVSWGRLLDEAHR